MKKLTIISITVLLLIVGVAGFSYYHYNSKQEQKEQYSKRLAETTLDINLEFILSSFIVSNYSDLWNKAIDNRKDFNLVLSNFQNIMNEKGLLEERETKQDEIRNNMKLLQNPPSEYEESYNELKKIYGTYTKMVDQALSPSGSLIEFNRYTGQLASQFEEDREQLEITLPADVKKLKKEIEKDKKEDDTKL